MHYLFRGITFIGEERESNRSGSDSVPLLRQNAYHWNTITLPWPIKTSVIFYHLTLQLVQVIKIRLLRSRDIKAFNARLFLSRAKGKEMSHFFAPGIWRHSMHGFSCHAKGKENVAFLPHQNGGEEPLGEEPLGKRTKAIPRWLEAPQDQGAGGTSHQSYEDTQNITLPVITKGKEDVSSNGPTYPPKQLRCSTHYQRSGFTLGLDIGPTLPKGPVQPASRLESAGGSCSIQLVLPAMAMNFLLVLGG